MAYGEHKRTQQDLLEDKEYKDYAENVEFNQRGLPHHLMTGHGSQLEDFEKRKFAVFTDPVDVKTRTKL